MLVRGEPPVEGHEERAQSPCSQDEHAHVRVVVPEEGDALALGDPEPGQAARCALYPAPERRIRKVSALEVEGGLSGRVLRPALDEAGHVQSSPSPVSFNASRPPPASASGAGARRSAPVRFRQVP